MSRLAALVLTVLLATGTAARAEELILALSTETVKITSNFTGTGITVFGAIERDAATVSRASFYDIVVVVKGPPETVVTRRKDRIAGLWINRASQTFEDMPSFYSVNASRALSDVTTPQTLRRYQLGLANLAFPTEDGGEMQASEGDPFREAFIRLKQKAGLYRQELYKVDFPGTQIFQTTAQIPANVPVGTYTATVYLFSDGAMLAQKSAEIVISKTGFEQLSFDLANDQGFLYGVICVLLAMFTGWIAGILFRRD